MCNETAELSSALLLHWKKFSITYPDYTPRRRRRHPSW